jgi:hypothetical protein
MEEERPLISKAILNKKNAGGSQYLPSNYTYTAMSIKAA